MPQPLRSHSHTCGALHSHLLHRPQTLLTQVCDMPQETEAGKVLADAVLAGGEQARVAARVILKKVCVDERDPGERG